MLGVAVLAASLLLGGDGDDAPTSASVTFTAPPAADLAPGTTATTSPSGLGVGVGDAVDGRTPLAGFGQVAARIVAGDGTVCEVCLLAAETPDQRERGLMAVTDPTLGGYDGMVFVYDAPTAGAFWMRNTPMPLSIAYFDIDGRLVSTADMAPCADSPDCRSYPAAAPFAFALEVPQGGLEDVGVVGEATLELTGRRCPLAEDG
ncbi:MAG: DUF192 domain-containing protein [Acidimicrobiales bacterium]|nr:DUF192 domain-containing protein [Acidimicrobiales bacterium]HRW38931.1 DUF192 domain-containing protein [Aquihabitans sp.]